MSDEQKWTPRVRRVEGDSKERIQHAASLMRDERYEEAQQELLDILQIDEKSTQARILLGTVYLRQQMHIDALDQFKQVIAADALLVPPHVLAGACYLRTGDIEQAKQELHTALQLDPKQASAHAGMAQIFAQSGQAAQAIPHLEEALRLDPQMSSARMLLAKLLNQAGNVDAAIEELTTLVNTEPEHTGASLQLAMMQRQKGNNEEAVELLEAVAKTNPDSAKIWDLLGRMKGAATDFAGAEKAFLKAIELKTTDRATPLRLIDSLIKQGKLDQARSMLESVPRRGGMKSVVQRFYGDLYAAKQLYDEAVECYRASLLNTPDGDTILSQVEAEFGPAAPNETKITHFRAAFAKLRQERRQAQAGGAEDQGRRLPSRQGGGAALTAEPGARSL